ncbi:uncharacterized protein LOC122624394 isoform X2 [Drosophila teissieri]|uniref:Uncharacterized protein, isoform E n=1 Tax=Drosophila erecta TaxID=7220 RepID=A0A0Q5T5B7_DROER|nr:uncharacterized protein LOC120456917 isoform X4 [Drosophila santomea]XP_043659850.1 uncharacterized protein LOC122624394 isoform X2 [Drosophila teissieri]KQS30460.1 uncharacterized protein Dere_GG19575, isoform E [Drosophila erecta]
MSFLGNTSDLECEKNEFPRQRPTGIITKVAAHKLSAEPKWTDKREDDSDSEVSSPDNFLTKGAFLLTPSYELSMERAALICEKMAFKGCFSLTKTATGILFKFSHPDDYQAVFKKGFHKVTGARFYRKIAIPCRPRKTFTLYVLDVPEDLPVEDIRHAMYKFDSVVEVVRLHIYSSLASNAANASSSAVAASSSSAGGDKGVEGVSKSVGSVVGDAIEKAERPERRELPPAVIRVTLASMDEYNILLQNGLNFYDATFFPTEANISLKGAKIDYKRRMLDGSIPGRVRELLPVFDAAGFCKLPPPTSKLIKPPRS